ncbi:unnamed protein product [Amoebophrya sp. A25]|nr:unnamed protein product [Amoebophrya sp. A25]|eukprot:GSA25T00010761001.1
MRRFLTIREGFQALDAGGEGTITLNELVSGLERYKFLHFFAKRVFRKLDVDGSGDLNLSELIDLKEEWALVENERQSVTKAEVDAMKEGWNKKEAILRRYYEESKKKAEELEQQLKEGGGGRGKRDMVNEEELKKVQEAAEKASAQYEKKITHLESQLSEIGEGYRALEDKCGKSIWQNRQDLVEVQKLKREKQEFEAHMGKLQRKYDALKRVRDANQFINALAGGGGRGSSDEDYLEGTGAYAAAPGSPTAQRGPLASAGLMVQFDQDGVPVPVPPGSPILASTSSPGRAAGGEAGTEDASPEGAAGQLGAPGSTARIYPAPGGIVPAGMVPVTMPGGVQCFAVPAGASLPPVIGHASPATTAPGAVAGGVHTSIPSGPGSVLLPGVDAHADPQTQALQQMAQLMREESAGIREVASASLFQKLEGKEVPYRIRNETITGAKKRWQLLYADAVHRKVGNTRRTNGHSLSPRHTGPHVASPPPLVHELRDAMAQAPQGSWSYDFRQFVTPKQAPAPYRQPVDAPPFSPSRLVTMNPGVNPQIPVKHSNMQARQTHHGGFLPKQMRKSLNDKRRQQTSLSPRLTPPGSPPMWAGFPLSSPLGPHNHQPPGGASRRYLIRTPPQDATRLGSGASQFQNINYMSTEHHASTGSLGASPTNITIGGETITAEAMVNPRQPQIVSLTIAPPMNGRSPSVKALSPRRSPSPRPEAGQAMPHMSDDAAAALSKNFGPASPRRRRDGALQVSYEDPIDLYNVAQAYQASRTQSPSGRAGHSGSLESPSASVILDGRPNPLPSRSSSPRSRKARTDHTASTISEGKNGLVSRINLSLLGGNTENQQQQLPQAQGGLIPGGLSLTSSSVHHPQVSTVDQFAAPLQVGAGVQLPAQQQQNRGRQPSAQGVGGRGGSSLSPKHSPQKRGGMTKTSSVEIGPSSSMSLGVLDEPRSGAATSAARTGFSANPLMAATSSSVGSSNYVSQQQHSGAAGSYTGPGSRSGAAGHVHHQRPSENLRNRSLERAQQSINGMSPRSHVLTISSSSSAATRLGSPGVVGVNALKNAPPASSLTATTTSGGFGLTTTHRSMATNRTSTAEQGVDRLASSTSRVPTRAATTAGSSKKPPQLNTSTLSLEFAGDQQQQLGGTPTLGPDHLVSKLVEINRHLGGQAQSGGGGSLSPRGRGAAGTIPGEAGRISHFPAMSASSIGGPRAGALNLAIAGPKTAGATPDFGMSLVASGGGDQHHVFEALPPSHVHTQNSFFSPAKKLVGSASFNPGSVGTGSLHKSPSMYKVPGGRYIPKKELPATLSALEINTNNAKAPSLAAPPALPEAARQVNATVAEQDPLGDTSLPHHNNMSTMSWDPRDPPGKKALPSTFAMKKSPSKRRNSNSTATLAAPVLSPFKTVDQWANKAGSGAD